jgi:plastocyanin
VKRIAVWGLSACLASFLAATSGVGALRAQGSGGGTISGRVTLTDSSIGNPLIRMGMDPKCSELNAGKRVFNESVLRSADGGLANAFVDLEGKFASAPPPKGVVELVQRNCVYTPRVVGAVVGQTLRIVNKDALSHNVHSRSSHANDFNFTQPTAGLTRDIVLKGPDVMMRVGCDIHSWMATYIGVESHPYFAVTGSGGAFTIAGVPPGRYPIKVWHERFGTLTQMVTVAAGKTVNVTLTYTGKEKPVALERLPSIGPLVTVSPAAVSHGPHQHSS